MVLIQGSEGSVVEVIDGHIRSLAASRSLLARASEIGEAYAFVTGIISQASANGEDPVMEIRNDRDQKFAIDRILVSVSGPGGAAAGQGTAVVYLGATAVPVTIGEAVNLNASRAEKFNGQLRISDGTDQTVTGGDAIERVELGDDSRTELAIGGAIILGTGNKMLISYDVNSGSANISATVYGYYLAPGIS